MAFELQTDPAAVRAESERLESLSLAEVLEWAWQHYGARAGIGTSFQGAGLVILHHVKKLGLGLPAFTLDTGLLFPETIELKKRLEEFLGFPIESVLPEQTVEEQGAEMGPELWKRNPDTCCILRKVMPLQKKLNELDVWITGLRRDQSSTREKTQMLELYKFDVLRDRYILKLNPVCHWSREAIWDYLREYKIPYNPLVDRGYRSIGCMPCTRATGDGESERAGRWTGFDKAECGIHTFLGSNI